MQDGRAVRTSLPAHSAWRLALALPALILLTVGTGLAELAPCGFLSAVALVVLGSVCSLTGAPLPPNPRASLRSGLPPRVFRFGLACVLVVTACGMRPHPVAFSLSATEVVAAAASGSRSPFARLAFRGRAPLYRSCLPPGSFVAWWQTLTGARLRGICRSPPFGRIAAGATHPSTRSFSGLPLALSSPPLLQKRCQLGATPPAGLFIGYRSVVLRWGVLASVFKVVRSCRHCRSSTIVVLVLVYSALPCVLLLLLRVVRA